MLRATKPTGKAKDYGRKSGRKGGRIRFPGIVADAAALQVNRITLYRTLTGQWRLPGLLKRYQQLKKERAA